VAMRELPIGTSYVVWVGIGAVLTVVYAMLTGGEPVSVLKVLLLAGIVGCVIGLKLVG
jgi:quaternary ammonium compound-resistance protein SugE